MQGRTNAYAVPPVRTVNGKTGDVVVNAGDVPYSNVTTYQDGTVGKTLKDVQNGIESLSPGFTYMGSVQSVSNLPTPSTKGYMYTVANEGYASFVYDGTAWHEWDQDDVTTSEIDALFA